jgi:excinuclease ABC subunit B
MEEISIRQKKDERVLVTTLTKRMAEDLTSYYTDLGIRARYLHSEINTFDRVDIIRGLRTGEFDVLVGINLLREGLDLPEVSLVAIMDADKEGFLRSEKSLIQTCGRASRNVMGCVIMYADTITKSMEKAISETTRRRKIQKAYNIQHNIEPATIKKKIQSAFDSIYEYENLPVEKVAESMAQYHLKYDGTDSLDDIIKLLKQDMAKAAKALEFEKAAGIRDQIKELNKISLF